MDFPSVLIRCMSLPKINRIGKNSPNWVKNFHNSTTSLVFCLFKSVPLFLRRKRHSDHIFQSQCTLRTDVPRISLQNKAGLVIFGLAPTIINIQYLKRNLILGFASLSTCRCHLPPPVQCQKTHARTKHHIHPTRWWFRP